MGSKVAGSTLGLGYQYGDVADINGDGNLDIAVSGADRGSTVGVDVFLGDGAGSFTSVYALSSPYNTQSTASFADLNGDGHLDILLDTDGWNSVQLGDGTGQFTVTNQTDKNGLGESIGGKIAVDINQDGILDNIDVGEVNLGIAQDGINAINGFSLATQADAIQALDPLKNKLNLINEQRGIIGALVSRLSSAFQTTRDQSDQLSAASSRIADLDVAQETAKLTSAQVRQQAATAILAQANQHSSLALRLLET